MRLGAEVADRRQKLADRGLHDVIQKRKHPRANRVFMTTALWESGIGSCVLTKKIVPKVLETFRKHSRILVKYRNML